MQDVWIGWSLLSGEHGKEWSSSRPSRSCMQRQNVKRPRLAPGDPQTLQEIRKGRVKDSRGALSCNPPWFVR